MMRGLPIVFTVLAFMEGRGTAQTRPRAEDIALQLGVDADALAKIRAGQVFQMARPDLTERDLAMGVVFACKPAPEKVVHEFLRGVDLGKDPSIVAFHRISAANAAQDLEALHLSPGGEPEAKKYRSAEDGDTLNLSSAESAAFRALPATASVADTEAQLHKMLLARYEAYHKGGVAALAPYARAHGRKRGLGEGVRVLAQSPPGMQRYASVMQTALRDYPKLPPGAEEAFYWIVYNHDDRPTVTLRHRLVLVADGVPLMVDREFYVSQGYNEMQAISGFSPFEGGTLVFYRVDIGTDRVGGASQSVKHSVGRRMVAKQLKAIIERTKAQLDR